MNEQMLFGIEAIPTRPDGEERMRKKRTWENAFQAWSDKHGMAKFST